MGTVPSGLLLGAAYYPEYERTIDRLDQDLDLMVEAGISLIRVGESSWSTWEPSDGAFDLEWMQPVLDAALARDISVVLGTPTYAIPPWLQARHPELAGQRATGSRIPWGSRQELDFTSTTFRYHAERVIRAVVGRYAHHPAVIGFQLDNEPGLELLHNDDVFAAFRESLEVRYGTLERLNEAWGLAYWSHRLTDWSELWRPDGNSFPEYDLAWREFQAGLVTDYIAWQADVVREYARADQFVTTCVSYSRPAIDDVSVLRALDVTAGNPYHGAQEALTLRPAASGQQSWASYGVQGLLRQADRLYSSRQQRFLVTETNAQAIGGSAHNFPPYPGQLFQAALAMVARGASAIEYWQWHTLHGGFEAGWGGILPHSALPGRVYDEVARIGAAFESLGSTLDGYTPDADLAMVWSNRAKWAQEFTPFLQRPNGEPDAASYERVFDAFYGGAVRAGAQVRVLAVEHLEQLAANDLVDAFPVLVVPALYIATDRELDLLMDYAVRGGHLVLGVRTGYADSEARARAAIAPPRMSDAAGVWYEEFSNLQGALPLSGSENFPLTTGAAAIDWLDGLQVVDAEVLAGYNHPEFDRFAAVTSRTHGAGRVTYVGCVPNAVLAEDLVRWAVPNPLSARALPARPREVSVLSGRTPAGERIWFVHNWSPNPAQLRLGIAGRNLLPAEPVGVENSISLDRWSAIIVAEGLPAGLPANPKGIQ